MKRSSIEEGILNYLEKDFFNLEKNDVIGDLFDEKFDEIQQAVIDTDIYKSYREQINEIENLIYSKISNNSTLITLIEKYFEMIFEREKSVEKLIYKYGIYNGMTLILSGTEKVDITKFSNDKDNIKE